MGVSPRTRVITRWGKRNLRVKQYGKREFITALEAVSAGEFLFTTNNGPTETSKSSPSTSRHEF